MHNFLAPKICSVFHECRIYQLYLIRSTKIALLLSLLNVLCLLLSGVSFFLPLYDTVTQRLITMQH